MRCRATVVVGCIRRRLARNQNDIYPSDVYCV
jgi:hypothetical protein